MKQTDIRVILMVKSGNLGAAQQMKTSIVKDAKKQRVAVEIEVVVVGGPGLSKEDLRRQLMLPGVQE